MIIIKKNYRNIFKLKKNNPHDKLFKATFSIPAEAKALVKNYLPKWISESVDYEDFELSSETYVKEEMEEVFMDILWSTIWKSSNKSVKISFLLEHKSYRDDFVKLQLGEYILGAYTRQRLNKEPLHVVIPVLIYHDKGKWKLRKLAELFDLPHPDLAKFIPNFEVLFLDVRRMADEVIIQTQESVYLKSTFLLFKYQGENDQLLRIIEEVFIFVERNLNEAEKQRFIKLYLHYLFSGFKLNKEESETVIQKIPPMIVQEFRNTYDVARDEGKIKGVKLSNFSSMLLFLRDFSDWSNEQIATYAKVKVEEIVKFKKLMTKKMSLKNLKEEIKKQFFKTIDLTKEEEKELMDLVKDYQKKHKK